MNPATVPGPLGILAGEGLYPKLLLDALTADRRRVAVAGLDGQAQPSLFASAVAYQTVPVGALKRTAAFFIRHGVSTIFFAGGIRRKGALRHTRPDRFGMRLLVAALSRGDDTLLRRAAACFEALGVTVADPAPWIGSLLAPNGHLAGPAPSARIATDLIIARDRAKSLGRSDKGQGVLVHAGKTVAVEGRGGTDALIARALPGAVLVKTVKPGQDRRFDLPAIGRRTIERCHRYGIRAVGVEAGGVLLLGRGPLFEACHETGISLNGLTGNSPETKPYHNPEKKSRPHSPFSL